MSVEAEFNRLAARDLRQAQRLVDGIARTLNGSRERCNHCGVDVLADKHQARQKEQLEGIVQKLTRIIGSFESDAEREEGAA